MYYPDISTPENLKAKFDVAGASARWMFQFSLTDVQEALNIAVQKVDNIEAIIKRFDKQRRNTVVTT